MADSVAATGSAAAREGEHITTAVTGIAPAEYAARIDSVRGAMAAQDIDALVAYSWKRGQVRYLTGYQPNYVANVAMAVVPAVGDPTLLIRFPFDLERAHKMSWLADIRGSGDLTGLVRDSKAVLRERFHRPGRLGLVTGDSVVDELPHSLYDRLRAALPDWEFVSASDLVETARLHKSTAEAGLLRASARVTDAALAAARTAACPGRTEYDVIAAAEATARGAGAEDILSVIAPAAWELVGPPEMRRLETEEMLVVEFAVQLNGYFSQAPGVFHTGAPTAEQRAMYAAAYAGYLAGLEAARPGRTIGDVARAELAALESAGWLEWHAYDLGHGDGLDHPELPAITPASSVPIEAGMVLCIHPGLRKPGVGGVFVGGTAIVEPGGAVPLHDVPPDLH